MYIVLKNKVVVDFDEDFCYVKQNPINKYFVGVENKEKSEFIMMNDKLYPTYGNDLRQAHTLEEVDQLPEGFILDGTWIFEDGAVKQSSSLKKDKETTIFLDSLSDLAMMELSARLDALEEKIQNI